MYNWTVLIVNVINDIEYGDMSVVFCDTKDEVFANIKELEDIGQNMEYVFVFPPKSNIEMEVLKCYI